MIHQSSVIDPKAKISENVKIGPFCYIGPEVQLEENVELISNVHIEGNTKIGKGTTLYIMIYTSGYLICLPKSGFSVAFHDRGFFKYTRSLRG